MLYGSRLTDMETCYKVMRTDVARALRLEANRFERATISWNDRYGLNHEAALKARRSAGATVSRRSSCSQD
jgi:hypothetical protein